MGLLLKYEPDDSQIFNCGDKTLGKIVKTHVSKNHVCLSANRIWTKKS